MKKRILTSLLLLSIPSNGDEKFSDFTRDLENIKWADSNVKSRFFVEKYSQIISNPDENKDRKNLLIVRARDTGNSDLLKIIINDVEKVDWSKERQWEEGLRLNNEFGEKFEILAKWNYSIQDKFFEYFMNAPDVPYERIGPWHDGFLGRGLQGTFLRLIATYNSKKFEEIIELLRGKDISLSKKRTILWSMRFDNSGISEELLKKGIGVEVGLTQEESDKSLKELFKRSEKQK